MDIMVILGLLGVAIVVALIGLVYVWHRNRSSSAQAAKPTEWLNPSDTPVQSPAKLLAMTGPHEGQAFFFQPPALQIGRQEDNHISLSDEQLVSGYHALIYYEKGEYVLVDQSVNGTWVNNERVTRHVLRPGDQIQIWTSSFVFEPDVSLTPAPRIFTGPPEVGEMFHGYRLLSILGEGGMARVYKAEASPGHVVAIKVFLHAHNKDLLKRFEEEARIGRDILKGHPHIVNVLPTPTMGEGLPYLVMECVQGRSLREHVAELRSNEKMIHQIILQVCNALHHAHSFNIVHRDIKPENILLDSQGKVKVTDFGIAKVMGGISVTRTNQVIGTPEYLAPEQVKGHQVTPATDIYALGVVLYELLTGQVPFPRQGNDLAANNRVMYRQLNENPPDPRQFNPQASVRLVQAVMKALAKEPADRFPSMKAFAMALGGHVEVYKTQMSAQRVPAYLEVLSKQPAQRIELSHVPFVLERNMVDEMDLHMSRRHFEITWEAGRYLVTNFSRNGTFCGGERVDHPKRLVHQSEIKAGRHLFRFCFHKP